MLSSASGPDGRKAARPLIVRARPVKGPRDPLCKTDEAVVSRMLPPGKYAGLVERLQRTGPDRGGMNFFLYDDREGKSAYQFGPSEPANAMLRFIALRFAASMFPRNFVNASELRLSFPCGRMQSAMYSDYVDDESGVIGRRAESMLQYYAEPGREERERIDAVSRYVEHSICPELPACMKVMEIAGILIPHPEANYHLSGEDVVFFEVAGIRLRRAFAFASELSADRDTSLALLSLMYAIMLDHYRSRNPAYFGNFREYADVGPDFLVMSVMRFFSGASSAYPPDSPASGEAFYKEDFHELVHAVFGGAAYIKHILREHPGRRDWPVWIDPSLF